jgi:hypothetical protein
VQKLSLVGFNEDRDGLVLRLDGGDGAVIDFELPADARLFAVVDELDPGGGEAGSEPQPAGIVRPPAAPRHGPLSALTPREMQDRLRSGRSVQEVAREAGVEPDWVARFAAPVLAEQAAVVDAARDATFHRPRVGQSAAPLGASVRRNVAGKGVLLDDEAEAEAWSARQVDGPMWLVSFRYRSRGRPQEARWTFDLESRELGSASKLAGQLGYVPSAGRASDVRTRAAARSRLAPAPPPPAPVRRARPVPKAAAAEAARRTTATPSRPPARASRKAQPAPPVAKKKAAARKNGAAAPARKKTKAVAKVAAAPRRATRNGAAVAAKKAAPARRRAAVPAKKADAANGARPRRAR